MTPYDPLNYDNLARSVVGALMEREPVCIPPEESFEGCGVYAIYYGGDFPAYRHLVIPKSQSPIYVGKAIPPGGRKGLNEPGGEEPALFRRLKEHAKSLTEAENLRLRDFRCRYLVVVPVWVTLAERFLLSHYRPIWNTVVDGFGNHPVGAGRGQGKRPRWDILHPGRPWARDLRAVETPEDVLAAVRAFLTEHH